MFVIRKHEVIGEPHRIQAGLLARPSRGKRGIPVIAVCARRVASKLLS